MFDHTALILEKSRTFLKEFYLEIKNKFFYMVS